jgi:hypothetical protein
MLADQGVFFYNKLGMGSFCYSIIKNDRTIHRTCKLNSWINWFQGGERSLPVLLN